MSVPPASTPNLLMGKPVKGGLPTASQILQYNSVTDQWEAVALPPGTPHNLLDGIVNQDTVAAAVQAGDLVYGNATPKWDRLPKGTNGFILNMTTGLPTWLNLTAAGYVKGGNPLALQTGIPLSDLLNAGGAVGDIIYWNGANFIRLIVGSNGQFLKLVGGVPAWTTPATVAQIAKTADETTASAAFVDITDLTVALPNDGSKAFLTMVLVHDNNVALNINTFCFNDNGVDQIAQGEYVQLANAWQIVTLVYVTTAAGQTVKGRMKTTANTMKVYGTAEKKSNLTYIRI